MFKRTICFEIITNYLILFFGVFFSLFLSQSLYADELIFSHYTNEDGLPSSYVKSIIQDSDGFIWFATRAGITRFDGQSFKEFPSFNNEGDKVKIYSNKLIISSDSVLIAVSLDGLYYYFDDDKECFYQHELLNNLAQKHLIQSIISTNNGFWICLDNKISFLDLKSHKLISIGEKLPFVHLPDDYRSLDIRENNNYLIVLSNGGSIYCIDKNRHEVKNHFITKDFNLTQFELYYIDSYNNVWIGVANNGLVRIDADNYKCATYSKELEGSFRLPHNLVHCFTEDHTGRLWIGTEAGLTLYNHKTKEISINRFNLNNPAGLNSNPIYDAFCDKQGNVWLGTYFGGVNFWSNEEKLFQIWESGLGEKQLRGNVVSCLTEDNENNLWIGLEDNGLNKLDRKTGKISYYSSDDKRNGLSYNNIHDLLFVSDTELWIASYTGGINILDTKTNKFRYLNVRNTPELPSDDIYSLMSVGDSIYISTSAGIVVYNREDRIFTRLKPEILGSSQFESMTQSGETLWFSSSNQVFCYSPSNDLLSSFDLIPEMNNINFVKADSKGQIWIGDCYKGLCLYNEKGIRYFNGDNGFPVSWVFSLEEGNDGWYWVSSDKGLVRFSPEKSVYVLYDNNSGVPFNQFNFRASFVDSDGVIYFGGNNGMVSFNGEKFLRHERKMDIAFTGMQLFNKPLNPGENKCLKQSINKSETIVLDYKQNVFTLEYTAFSYSSKGRCQYAYYLEGFETDWNYVGNRNFASYTNLNPGTYIFHVKGSLDNINTATTERTLTIIVRPPVWLSRPAIIGYFIFICLFIFLVYKVGKNLEKSKAMLLMERREREHANEINKVKLEFFTNISHELKTPLTLILGPLSRIITEEQLSPAFRRSLLGIERNANRLFQLINQLLEFRKIENGKEKLQIAESSISSIIDDIARTFTDLADMHDIEFLIHYPLNKMSVWIDSDKVDKIIINLLSNAFKFTKEGGKIDLSVDIVKRNETKSAELFNMIISVSDSGKGIKPELINKVFDRFFMDDDGHENNNSGIGLAFVKSLVLLHKGEISVKSQENIGSVFEVSLPVSKNDYSQNEIVSQMPQYISSVEGKGVASVTHTPQKMINIESLSQQPLLLLVEDNIELIFFLKDILETKYRIVMASNGVEALEKLEKVTPDLIISDIMMPLMDGIEFTRSIKDNVNTSHIPVILLTSKSGSKNELEGLMTGADYYIEKPFYPDLLERIIENIINTRKRYIERFRDDICFDISEMPHSESDKAFIERLTNIVKSNINDSSLDVTFLLNKMGVSRSLLHIKLKGLVGCSSTEFIRAIRLKESVKLISTGKCNISEAAYVTGFSSPAYFTRCFKEFYGKSPREYFEN